MEDIKANILVIDSVKREIVEKLYSENPTQEANNIAKGYFEKGEGTPKHEHIPTKKHPNRYGVLTPTDFFIHYLK